MTMVTEASLTEKIIATLIMCVVNMVALFGNLLICVVTVRSKRRKAPTNMLLLSLCTADLVMATMDIPLTIVSLVQGRWIFGYIVCQIQGFTAIVTGMVGILIVALIAINRYCCVVRRELLFRWFTQRACFAAIVSAWLFALLTIIAAISTKTAEFRYYADRATCFIAVKHPTVEAVYSLFVLVTFIVIPCVVILYCYSRVVRVVKVHRESIRHNRMFSAEEVNMTYTFLALILGFLICLFPVFVLELIDTFCHTCMTRAMNLTHIFCFYASSSTNFVIYGIMNRSFRSRVARMVQRLACGRNTRDQVHIVAHSTAWITYNSVSHL